MDNKEQTEASPFPIKPLLIVIRLLGSAVLGYFVPRFIKQKKAEEYLNKGDECFVTGEYDEAMQYYNKAIECSPNNTVVYVQKGKVFTALGKNKDALAVYEKALKINPDDSSAYYRKVGILYLLGNIEESKKLYKD